MRTTTTGASGGTARALEASRIARPKPTFVADMENGVARDARAPQPVITPSLGVMFHFGSIRSGLRIAGLLSLALVMPFEMPPATQRCSVHTRTLDGEAFRAAVIACRTTLRQSFDPARQHGAE